MHMSSQYSASIAMAPFLHPKSGRSILNTAYAAEAQAVLRRAAIGPAGTGTLQVLASCRFSKSVSLLICCCSNLEASSFATLPGSLRTTAQGCAHVPTVVHVLLY